MRPNNQISDEFSDAISYASGGKRFKDTINVSANATEQHDLSGFSPSDGTIPFLQFAAASGTTGTDLSIHTSTAYDLTDMLYRATGISINDSEPTGGFPSSFSGLPWHEDNGNDTIHIKTVENSGTSGTISIRIYHL